MQWGRSYSASRHPRTPGSHGSRQPPTRTWYPSPRTPMPHPDASNLLIVLCPSPPARPGRTLPTCGNTRAPYGIVGTPEPYGPGVPDSPRPIGRARASRFPEDRLPPRGTTGLTPSPRAFNDSPPLEASDTSAANLATTRAEFTRRSPDQPHPGHLNVSSAGSTGLVLT